MKHISLFGPFCAILLGLAALPTHAEQIEIVSMNVSSAHVDAPFLPAGGFDLNPTITTNLVNGYIYNPDAITITRIGMAGEQILYTADTNKNPNGNGPAAGTITGALAPTGFVDLETNTVSVDLSSLFANHGPMDQNLGGTATGPIDPMTGAYTMTLTAILSQGPNAGLPVNFTFSGRIQLDQIPARESACSNISGAALGLCTAYCGAMECDCDGEYCEASTSVKACRKIRKNFMRITGESGMPCDTAANMETN
jgi:hypothetical protein